MNTDADADADADRLQASDVKSLSFRRTLLYFSSQLSFLSSRKCLLVFVNFGLVPCFIYCSSKREEIEFQLGLQSFMSIIV